MKIKDTVKYATSLNDDVKFVSAKLKRLSYLIPDETNDLIDTLTELQNYTEDICSILINKANSNGGINNDTSRL